MLEAVKQMLDEIGGCHPVFFYAVDPGAYRVLSPVYRDRGNVEIRWVLEGWARDNGGIENALRESEFCTLISNGNFVNACLVMGPQSDFSKTQDMIDFAKQHGVRCIFAFDHWCNYSAHFYDPQESKINWPDRVCVMDEHAAQALRNTMSGLVAETTLTESIRITGHAGMEESVQKIQAVPEQTLARLRDKFGCGGKKVYLFLMEPIEQAYGFDKNGRPKYGYSEYSILEYFFGHIDLKGVHVVVKPHPRHELSKITSYVDTEIRPSFPDVSVENDEAFEDLIALADHVFGVTTVALIIASCAGKPISSIQAGRNYETCMVSHPLLEENLIV